MGLIQIKGMKFYAFHGHFEAERIVGNNFEVNLTLKTDCKKAAITDKLEDALNYQAVYDLVKAEMKISSHLIENVAQRILDSVGKAFPTIEKATVKVSKLNPPMEGEIEKVSITLSSKMR